MGRYVLHDKIASGGMATVRFGRFLGPGGFARTVAVKCLHPQLAEEPEFVAMFLDEARLAARIRSPHVVPTLDIVAEGDDVFLVMEYVPGESLWRILRDNSTAVPVAVAVSIVCGVLQGLHAAHEARSEQGAALDIVHRDVSPQNILVGTDGVAQLIDFGIAKAAGRLVTTREGAVKGKLGYMPPEQLRGAPITRRADLYSTAVVLWEVLAGRRLFSGPNEGATITRVLGGDVPPPSRAVVRARGEEEMKLVALLDAVVMRGLERDPALRFETAREMARALEARVTAASAPVVGVWLERVAGAALAGRATRVADIESGGSGDTIPSASARDPAFDSGAPGRVTHTSGISVVSGVDKLPRRPAWPLLVPLAVATILALALSWAAVRGASPATTSAVGPLPSLDTMPPPNPPASASAAPSLAIDPPLIVVAPPDDAPAASPRASSVGAARPPGIATRTLPRPPPADCNPPYTWDPQTRTKHYKVNCL